MYLVAAKIVNILLLQTLVGSHFPPEVALFVCVWETGKHHSLYCYWNQEWEDEDTVEAVLAWEVDLDVEDHEG